MSFLASLATVPRGGGAPDHVNALLVGPCMHDGCTGSTGFAGVACACTLAAAGGVHRTLEQRLTLHSLVPRTNGPPTTSAPIESHSSPILNVALPIPATNPRC